MIVISTATSKEMGAKFSRRDVPDLISVASIITRCMWSPCIWSGGKRAKSNFLMADLVSLDFDSGEWTLQDAVDWLEFAGVAGVVGPTRSHQKQKGEKPACDRFRVVFQLNERQTDTARYEAILKKIMAPLPADKAVKDAGRLFFPCQSIFKIVSGGMYKTPDIALPKKRTIAPSIAASRESRIMPQWLQNKLQDFQDGNRNKLAFYFTCRLKEIGFNQGDIHNLLARYSQLEDKELSRTISQAWKY